MKETYYTDTADNFASSYAGGLSSALKQKRREIEANGGKSRFVGLYEGSRRVKAREIESPYGTSWLLHEDEHRLISRRGKPFLPTGRKSRVLKGLGLSERYEMQTAGADLNGGGKGMSGMAGVYVEAYRTGCKWGSEAELLTEKQ